MSSTLTNGRQRKSLAEQIDRLDSVLDGLADGLNEAVAAAVKEGLRAVLSDVLTNPELLAGLHAAQPQTAPEPARPWLARAWGRVRAALGWTVEQVEVCRAGIAGACGRACETVAEGVRRIRTGSVRLLAASGWALFRARWILGPMLTAVVLAGLTGVAAYHLGPWMAAGVSGAGGLGTALASPVNGSRLRWHWPWRAAAE